ncbi:MBL fold metallo-hydrolase [Aetokthonos hydrillicola Thurmond2011]|jgi:glyoxylase-like metal-dependent hydrolase (beta-lactamase superfamily II)|uniref:MBL fold metallo-hydrolase n=1 Tax=Aetokthonos hydrillicola Thurmond2011 TaxID=2712845 RepID=A0AAP5IE68_9CYAN|nr:MBL fold metallo-hydrolase [Aetokthonos hydrillicola]MBO3462469.1 MBL fold metallo-hydrolase [Aetokthonos hydrillicola CCALA 1050]MBW4589837.1 MBL fold metallo-hydrolase [Aetokthonos hydrillicola CCALA 1050]MDR9898407.1 MBL fold metallo-hydrolase [Aetokthonos hydrillicola Thurmond2011]
MKLLHRPDLYSWSSFDKERNIDFNSIAWIRPEGNVLIDPLPLSAHDHEHLNSLGSVKWIVVTNSDHIRAAKEISHVTNAQVAAPSAEQDSFPIPCFNWLSEGNQLVPGLEVIELHGSKTPGELALLLEKTTLITGDLVRSHQPGKLTILPAPKLSDRQQAVTSVHRLAKISDIETVLVGDGWSVFRNGSLLLNELAASL